MGICQPSCGVGCAGPGAAADGHRRRSRGWVRPRWAYRRQRKNKHIEREELDEGELGGARQASGRGSLRISRPIGKRTLKRRRRKSEAANPKRDLGSYIGEAGITPIRWGARFQLTERFSPATPIYTPPSSRLDPRPAPSRLPRILPRTRHRLSLSCVHTTTHKATQKLICSLSLPDYPTAHHE